MKSKIFRLFSLIVALAMITAPASARTLQPALPGNAGLAKDGPQQFEAADVEEVSSWTSPKTGVVIDEVKGATGSAPYAVLLQSPSLANYAGGIDELKATAPVVTGQRKLDPDSSASLAYLRHLDAEQAEFVASIEGQFNHPIEVIYHYRYVLNGIALVLTPEEAAAVANLPQVRMVARAKESPVSMDASPEWIGATSIWDGTATGGLPGTEGEGIIIGILDTGINSDHPSFADVGLDGYDTTNPWGAGTYVGVCDPTNTDFYTTTFQCNDKLIGAWEFAYYTINNVIQDWTDKKEYKIPEDENGHGSNTSSIAAGNFVTGTVTAGDYVISGIAPHANIIMYDVCFHKISTGGGSCYNIDSVAAADQAVEDGVDAINFSVGGGEDPYNDMVEMAFLDVVNAGIFVATSAGNAGPDAETVEHLGPWVASTGATTHNRSFVNALVDMTGGTSVPPTDMIGKGDTLGYGPAKIVYAGDYGAQGVDEALCAPNIFPAGTFSGEIVVCDRGNYDRVAKAQSVADGGAGGFVLVNLPAGAGGLYPDAYVIPGVHLDAVDGVALKTWLADGGTDHTATIQGEYRDVKTAYADIMADFSSRGPNAIELDVLKPNLTAPGVEILGAVNTADPTNPGPAEFALYDGTSMASPHIAGAAALLTGLHPDWTPPMMLSALMMTANPQVLLEDGVTPARGFAAGSGRVDLSRAAEAELVLDETNANFLAADPSTSGDPTTLNIASMYSHQCAAVCSFTRTFTSTVGVTTTWTVSVTKPAAMMLTISPSSFNVGPYGTQTVVVTATVTGMVQNRWAFAEIRLHDATGPDLRLPMAVYPTTGIFPDSVRFDTRRDAGSQVIADVVSAYDVPDLTVEYAGLQIADTHTEELSQDPTNDDPYDAITGTFYITITIPADTLRLVAEVSDSEAPDVDLLVGRGTTPSESTELTRSGSPSWDEYINLDRPSGGIYWIMVQVYTASANAPDWITLSYAAVDLASAGNMTVEVDGGGSITPQTPFDLRLYWDEPAMQSGDRLYGAFSLGTDATHPGNLAPLVDVDIARWEDDVTKQVSSSSAVIGSTLTYTITVQPNVTGVDLTYLITDTIPADLTYVPGSAIATSGSVNVTGDTLTWTGLLPGEAKYTMATSDTDPTNCGVPLANSGAYTNLVAVNPALVPIPAVTGDTIVFKAFSTGAPINFYGADQTGGLSFVDDGFAFLNSTRGSHPWVNAAIPTTDDPNNLMAILWNDWEVVYNAAANKGVTLAQLGGTGPGSAVVIEYDDLQVYHDPTQKLDMEVFAWRSADNTPGAYEVIFAYDNISITLTTGTVGVENSTGTAGTQFANDDAALSTIHDGMAICFDWASLDPVTITYQVTVNNNPSTYQVWNSVWSFTDNPGDVKTNVSVEAWLQDLTQFFPVMYR